MVAIFATQRLGHPIVADLIKKEENVSKVIDSGYFASRGKIAPCYFAIWRQNSPNGYFAARVKIALTQTLTSSYVYGVFGAQRSRDCTVTVLVSQYAGIGAHLSAVCKNRGGRPVSVHILVP